MKKYLQWALLGLVAVVAAVENVAIQGTVQAGIDTQGTIANSPDTSGKPPNKFGFTNYRIYLAMNLPGGAYRESCTLVTGIALDKTTFTINVPLDVGPSGEHYSLAVVEYFADKNGVGQSGLQYSNTIDLQGATGNWSQAELDGKSFIDPDRIYCTAYACARSCVNEHYSGETGENGPDWIPREQCINACPGVFRGDINAVDSPNNPSTGSAPTNPSTTSASSSTTSTDSSSTLGASTTLAGSSATGSPSTIAGSATSAGAASTLTTSSGQAILFIIAAFLLL